MLEPLNTMNLCHWKPLCLVPVLIFSFPWIQWYLNRKIPFELSWLWSYRSQILFPPEFVFTWNLRMWLYLEIGSLQMLLVNMRSYWVRVGTNSNDCDLMTQTQGEGNHIKMEVEIGSYVATPQGRPRVSRCWKRQVFSPRAFGEGMALPNFDFRLLTSRTVRE